MAVKRILTTRAAANMILAEDVYSPDNKLIVKADTVLNDEIIESLNLYSVFAIRIKVAEAVKADESQAGEETIPESSDQKYFDRVRESESFKQFHSSFVESVEDIKDSFNLVVMNNEKIDSDKMLRNVEDVIGKGRNNLHILDMLHCMRGYNDVTYVHSLNVSLLSNMIGRIVELDMSEDELDVLTMAGLLHDIGKMMIPESILNKRGHLTDSEYNVIKTHVLHGYNILKNQSIDPRVARAALLHHERCDLSGYPGGYSSDKIDKVAKIVSIADVYDAMTSDRVYREAICPFDVIKMFERTGLTKFDPSYLLPFLEVAVQSYLNIEVELSTDSVGKVVLINKNDLSRPVVRVDDKFLDLSKNKEVSISKILNR